METRELYKQKYEAQIHEWSAKLEGLIAHTDKLTAQAKLDAKPRLDAIHEKMDAAKARLHDIALATDDKWDDVKAGAEHAWHEVKGAVEGAYDAIKPEKKD
ncbi:MAG: coiled coil domain-containing protein [Byssovorax sp.]